MSHDACLGFVFFAKKTKPRKTDAFVEVGARIERIGWPNDRGNPGMGPLILKPAHGFPRMPREVRFASISGRVCVRLSLPLGSGWRRCVSSHLHAPDGRARAETRLRCLRAEGLS